MDLLFQWGDGVKGLLGHGKVDGDHNTEESPDFRHGSSLPRHLSARLPHPTNVLVGPCRCTMGGPPAELHAPAPPFGLDRGLDPPHSLCHACSQTRRRRSSYPYPGGLQSEIWKARPRQSPARGVALGVPQSLRYWRSTRKAGAKLRLKSENRAGRHISSTRMYPVKTASAKRLRRSRCSWPPTTPAT